MGKDKSKGKVRIFVLDCSITVAWFFEDEADEYAEAVQDSLMTASGLVPALWPLEVANALLVGERRKRTTEAKSSQFLTLLSSLPIDVDEANTSRAWSDVVNLARAQNLSAYDATYLELARRRALPLATLDARLKAAAQKIGIPEFQP